MSRGRRRLRRLILQSVNSTRYGCTVGQLAYRCYDLGWEAGPTEAQFAAVDRAMRLLVDDGHVVERTMLGTQRCFVPASPAVPGSAQPMLACLGCDLFWVSEEGAPQPLCWSCDEPGQPVRLRKPRRAPTRHG
jgi:hypothetical protein